MANQSVTPAVGSVYTIVSRLPDGTPVPGWVGGGGSIPVADISPGTLNQVLQTQAGVVAGWNSALEMGAAPPVDGGVNIDQASFTFGVHIVNGVGDFRIDVQPAGTNIGDNAHQLTFVANGVNNIVWRMTGTGATCELIAQQATAKILGSATSLIIRDRGDANDNVVFVDSGVINFRGGASVGAAGGWINPAGVAIAWSGRSQLSSPADSVLVMTNAAGTAFNRLGWGGSTASFPAWKFDAANRLRARLADDSADALVQVRSLVNTINTITYSASMTPDASLGDLWVITATNGTAFTINAPTNPLTGQRINLMIRNASGGGLGVATFNAVFKQATFATTPPANGFSDSADFRYDGTNWVQQTPWTNNIPN